MSKRELLAAVQEFEKVAARSQELVGKVATRHQELSDFRGPYFKVRKLESVVRVELGPVPDYLYADTPEEVERWLDIVVDRVKAAKIELRKFK